MPISIQDRREIYLSDHPTKYQKISDIDDKAAVAVKSWSSPGTTFKGKIQAVVSSYLPFIPAPQEKQEAETPHHFEPITEENRALFEKKANSARLLITICIVAGGILLFGGIILPFVATPLLMLLPLAIASKCAGLATLAGVAGVVVLVSSLFFDNRASLREARVKGDADFHYFITDICKFWIKEEHLTDKKLHQLYINWKNDLGKYC